MGAKVTNASGNALQRAIGGVVRTERLARALSQEEFAELICLHRTYIGSVERGERNISLQNLVAIARALGMPVSALLAEAERFSKTKGGK
jgi:transcriptional regulator with XRE-family HTH domain